MWVACSQSRTDVELAPRRRHPLQAYCVADVEGVGPTDVELDYLPHVVQCENGGAPLPALKAQAVAARSYLYYKLATAGSVADGESDQVYSCGVMPTADAVTAVEETSGQVLTFKGEPTCAFYVAGAKQVRPTCAGNMDHYTERFVTHNWGRSRDDVQQTGLGWVHASNHRNRGCMSQWGARCLAEDRWMYPDILRFYYGMDVTLETASGPCVTPTNRPPRGELLSVTCDSIRGWAQDPDEPSVTPYIRLSFDGPPGDAKAHTAIVRAGTRYAEACDIEGVCARSFAYPTPLGLRDGSSHSVYAFALDSAGGVDAPLAGSPSSFLCDPPAPPHGPAEAVLRPIPSMDAANAWQLSLFEDAAIFTDDEISDFVVGPPLPEAPRFVRAPGASSDVFSLDLGTKRRLSGPVQAWRLDDATVATETTETLHAMPDGPEMPRRPFLIRGSGPALYLLDVAWGSGNSDVVR